MHSSVPKTKEPARRKVTLELRADLLDEARAAGLDPAEIVEAALRRAVRGGSPERWLAENRAALEAYDARVEGAGTFGDDYRTF